MTDLTITYKNILLTICVEHCSPFVAGRHNGPPEDCQEDEQEEIEWLIVNVDIKDEIYQDGLSKEYCYYFACFSNNSFPYDSRQEIHTLISKEINQHQVTRRQHRNPSVMPNISFSGS